MADSQFARPELPQLIATIRSDLLTRFQQDVVLRRMDAEVYSRVPWLRLGMALVGWLKVTLMVQVLMVTI